MSWLAVMLTVNASSVEALSDALLEMGALSVDVSDADADTEREHAVFSEPGELGARVWERSVVRALFDEHNDITAKVNNALRSVGLDSDGGYEVECVADRDWVRATRDQFQPLQVSRRLWVVPTWHTPPDLAAINLIIDPGLAFGTGTHPTTRLCLQWLDDCVCGGESVLDYGCGSGILAIAAIKLGAGRATAIDIDAAALLAARHNAMQNQVAVQFESAAQSPSAEHDIVLANILAGPLVVLAPLLAHATRSGGRIVLSGLLEQQAAEVSDTYSVWFAMDSPRHDEGWVLLSGVRREAAR